MNMGESNRRRFFFLAKVFNCISDLTENSVLAREEMSFPCSSVNVSSPNLSETCQVSLPRQKT